MKSNSYKFLLFVFTCLLELNIAWAGPGVNNGGGGWACRSNQTHKFTWIKTLEMSRIEMENRTFRAPLEKTAIGIYREKLKFIHDKVPSLQTLFSRENLDIEKIIRYTPGPFDFIDDGSLLSKPGANLCLNGTVEHVQIADFLIDGTLLIDSNLWNDPAMNELNRGMLLLHEIVFKAMRDQKNNVTSDATQAIVMSLFSADSEKPSFDALISVILKWDNPPDKSPGSFGVIPFGFKLICGMSVEQAATPNRHKFVQWKDLSRNEKRKEVIDGFQFYLNTWPEDGRPFEMTIEDLESHVVSRVGDLMLMPTFLATKRVQFQMSRGVGNNTATAEFICHGE